MKFRFYITDTFEGQIVGTDSEATALNFATNEDYFVVDTETGRWLQSGSESAEVEASDVLDN